MKKSNHFFLVIATMLLLFSCKNDVESEYTEAVKLSINYEVPKDLPVDATQEDIAVFAWNEFFALNWKAAWDENSQVRVKPDKNWTLGKNPEESQPELSVWETYIHRTELRPADGKITKSLETGKPTYTFTDFNNSKLKNSKYWNFLDEDNEIGSAYLFSHKNESEVLYMAKTNLVEYNYLKQYYPEATELKKARKNTKNIIGTLSAQEMCNSVDLSKQGYVCLPCGDDNGNEGAIEIKMAFRKLNPSKDNVDRFMVKEVLYFKEGEKDTPVIDKYGLIGMHIIHKTKNHPTFVFASWEQVDVRNNNMQTIGIDDVIVDNITYADVDPHRLNPVIERNIPETIRKVNQKAKELIIDQNLKSKWQYYQLIGTQATPVDYKNRTEDSNYFMANYVIESDLTLTNFHGSFSDPFNSEIQNVAYNKKTYNMGGCMGCHGQAQKSGSDFSFLVDDDNFSEPDLLQTYQQALQSVSKKTAFVVNSKKPLQSTGLKIGDKFSYKIKYRSGAWTADPKTNGGKLYDANGNPNIKATSGYPLPGANAGALIGQIGSNPVFLIGDGPTDIPTGQLGELKLVINDDINQTHGSGLSDNKGSITVDIEYQKK